MPLYTDNFDFFFTLFLGVLAKVHLEGQCFTNLNCKDVVDLGYWNFENSAWPRKWC